MTTDARLACGPRNLGLRADHAAHRARKGNGIGAFAPLAALLLSVGALAPDSLQSAQAETLTRLTAKLPVAAQPAPRLNRETSAGWLKSSSNPVLGGTLGTCFDLSVLHEENVFRMWFSWRPKASLALVESRDGIHWTDPVVVLGPNPSSGWEEDINRPVVLKRADGYHLWYTGQAKGRSVIGYATSSTGLNWKRMSSQPVLSPEAAWENAAVMCPHVLWDAELALYRMWFSGGEQYEPNAIGYATSPDGLHWTKSQDNPIFRPEKSNPWEQERVTACQVVQQGGWHWMFYIGFRDVDHAQIGLARSRDGITHWERHPENPIIRTGFEQWDHDAVYKPWAVLDGGRWLLWYNGRRGNHEQIGLAIHEGVELW